MYYYLYIWKMLSDGVLLVKAKDGKPVMEGIGY